MNSREQVLTVSPAASGSPVVLDVSGHSVGLRGGFGNSLLRFDPLNLLLTPIRWVR